MNITENCTYVEVQEKNVLEALNFVNPAIGKYHAWKRVDLVRVTNDYAEAVNGHVARRAKFDYKKDQAKLPIGLYLPIKINTKEAKLLALPDATFPNTDKPFKHPTKPAFKLLLCGLVSGSVVNFNLANLGILINAKYFDGIKGYWTFYCYQNDSRAVNAISDDKRFRIAVMPLRK